MADHTSHHSAEQHGTQRDKSQYHQQAYEPYQPHPGDAKTPSSGATILSVKRGVALSVVGVAVFLLLAVIGLSAGLGVSQRDLRHVRGDLAAAQAALSGAPTPTSADTSAPSPSAVSDVQCPGVNGTVYTASTGGKRFRRTCGIDYGGEGEAVDIGNVKTRSLDACIDACAAQANCTGAGWGVIEGDIPPLHSCWMKTNLTTPHTATPDWGFAVLVDGAETGGTKR